MKVLQFFGDLKSCSVEELKYAHDYYTNLLASGEYRSEYVLKQSLSFVEALLAGEELNIQDKHRIKHVHLLDKPSETKEIDQAAFDKFKVKESVLYQRTYLKEITEHFKEREAMYNKWLEQGIKPSASSLKGEEEKIEDYLLKGLISEEEYDILLNLINRLRG